MIPDLSIVIVSMNLRDDTAACIESLLAAGASLEQITVSDNCSTDGTPAFLREKFGQALTVVEGHENRGYAYGVNMGLQDVLPKGARWIFLMNNDTVVDPDMFKLLMDAAGQFGESYAILGPLILFHSEPTKIWYLGDRLIPGTMITINPYFMKELPKGTPAIQPVDFLNGCGMLIRRDVFEKVGLWETRFFMYGDEVDFRFRTHRMNYKMACVTTAKMWHKVSAIMKQMPAKTRYYRTRNQVWIYRKYATGLQYPMMLLFTMGRAAVISLKDLVLGHKDVAFAIWRGWWDGWMKERGI